MLFLLKKKFGLDSERPVQGAACVKLNRTSANELRNTINHILW